MSIASLAMMAIGMGLGMIHFYSTGERDWLIGGVMIFIVAVSIGTVIVRDIERHARRDRRNRGHEVPPPPDVYAVWPPAIHAGEKGTRKDSPGQATRK